MLIPKKDFSQHAYPRKRFQPNLFNRYETCVANGTKDLTAEEHDEMFNVERSHENNTSGNTSINNELLNDNSIGHYNDQKEKFLTYFIRDNNRETWVLVSNANVVLSNSIGIITSTVSAQKEKNNFKEFCLQWLDRCQHQKAQPPQKRKKVNPYGSIVTSEQQLLNAEGNSNTKKGNRQKKRKVAANEDDDDE